MKDLENYLDIFHVVKIDERETIRFNHKKNYLIFIVKKYVNKMNDKKVVQVRVSTGIMGFKDNLEQTLIK